MNRKQFLDNLATVSPALSDSSLIPVLTHFCFTGRDLVAYNDTIGISVPQKTDFEGAVPGVLLNLLKSTRAKEVEFEPKDDNVKVKASSTKFNLGLVPAEDFTAFFTMPKSEGDNLPLKNKQGFFKSVEGCLRSIGTDTGQQDQLGVTLIPEGKKLLMYTTNTSTISHDVARLTGDVSFERITLPKQFCEQMLKMGKGAKSFHLEIHDDYALMVADKVMVYSRLLFSDAPLEFQGILEQHFPEGMEMVPMPSKLKGILERAIIITDSANDQGTTDVVAKDGVMKFISKTERGEVVDRVQVGDSHPQVSVKLEPRQLKTGYADFYKVDENGKPDGKGKFIVTDRCVIMSRGDAIYMVSAHGV